VKGRSTYVPSLGFQQNKTSCNKIAISPFTSTKYHRIAENYLLYPRNQEHKTLIAEISIQNQQNIHKRPPPSIVHKRERPRRMK
jgi:hypothetical protein